MHGLRIPISSHLLKLFSPRRSQRGKGRKSKCHSPCKFHKTPNNQKISKINNTHIFIYIKKKNFPSSVSTGIRLPAQQWGLRGRPVRECRFVPWGLPLPRRAPWAPRRPPRSDHPLAHAGLGGVYGGDGRAEGGGAGDGLRGLDEGADPDPVRSAGAVAPMERSGT